MTKHRKSSQHKRERSDGTISKKKGASRMRIYRDNHPRARVQSVVGDGFCVLQNDFTKWGSHLLVQSLCENNGRYSPDTIMVLV